MLERARRTVKWHLKTTGGGGGDGLRFFLAREMPCEFLQKALELWFQH